MNVEVIWHDGKTSRAYEASLDFSETGFVRLTAENLSFRYEIKELRSTEPVGKIKPKLYFPDGSSCELSDLSAISAYLPKSSRLFEFIHRCESKFIYAAGVAVLSIGVFYVLIFYAVPEMARQVANQLPPLLEKSLGGELLETLDRIVFEESSLSEDRQANLSSKFLKTIEVMDTTAEYQILFRSSPKMGANALALPSGIIIFTDEIVELAKSDDALIGVLAHEVGHIEHHHSIRHVLQDSVVALLLVTITGDISSISSIGAALPTLMVQLKFSREFEAEADDFAIRYLIQNNISTEPLLELLKSLDAEYSEEDSTVSNYFSSHPATIERIKKLKRR